MYEPKYSCLLTNDGKIFTDFSIHALRRLHAAPPYADHIQRFGGSWPNVRDGVNIIYLIPDNPNNRS